MWSLPSIVFLILPPLIVFFFFPLDAKSVIESSKGKFEEKYWYCFIALLIFPLCSGATWCFFCRKRPIQTPEINQVQIPRPGEEQVQNIENADALRASEMPLAPAVTVAEEIMQDQQIVGDSHITIVSSAYVYQTAIILTDEEIALHYTGPLCSADIVH